MESDFIVCGRGFSVCINDAETEKEELNRKVKVCRCR